MEFSPVLPPVEFAPKALIDLTLIARSTTETWGSAQSEQYETELFNSIEHLAGNVRIGRRERRLGEGVRIWVVLEHLIVYRVIDERPRVLRVVHQRQLIRTRDIRE
jgi:plasmid stabilization system protein ParE